MRWDDLPGFGQAARWMSRRNGESSARAMAARIEEFQRQSPNQPQVQYWQQALEVRPGWRRVKTGIYEFRTGERLELKEGTSSQEILSRMTAIEVRPLGEGLPPDVQKALIADAVEAAVAWWKRHGEV